LAAERRRTAGRTLRETVLVAASNFVTGFSIGNAYVPAAGLLILAAALAAAAGFGRDD
jgi:hypothetical protein